MWLGRVRASRGCGAVCLPEELHGDPARADPRVAIIRRTLASFVALAPRVIILDRLPLAADGVPRILVQRLSRKLYPGSYPLWTLARDEVFAALSGRYRLLEAFTCPDAPVLRGAIRADYGGSTWLRREPA